MIKDDPLAESLEQGIELALKHNTAYRVEWYSLGRTNDDFRAYLKEHEINQKVLGIFIAGNRKNNPNDFLLVMPRSWIVEGSSAPYPSEEIDPHLQPKTL